MDILSISWYDEDMLGTIGIAVPTILYLALSTIHLFFCRTGNEKHRMRTKPFLLMLLGISMCFFSKDYPLIPIACFLACIGDIILLFDEKPFFFLLGATFFASSHVLNILTQCAILGWELQAWHYILLYIAIPIASLLGYFVFEKGKKFSLFKYAFATLHLENVIFSLILFFTGTTASGMMIFIGYVCCIASDIILEKAVVGKTMEKSDFIIMLLYLVGQLFTYYGLAFGIHHIF